MKNIFLPAFLFLSFLFSACENPEKNRVVHEMAYKIVPVWQKIAGFRIAMMNAEVRNIKWINIPGSSEEKTKQTVFVNETYTKMRLDLVQVFKGQPANEQSELDSALVLCDQQIKMYKDIMDQLSSVVAYNDPAVFLPLQSMVLDNDGECAVLEKNSNNDLEYLFNACDGKMTQAKDDLEKLSEK